MFRGPNRRQPNEPDSPAKSWEKVNPQYQTAKSSALPRKVGKENGDSLEEDRAVDDDSDDSLSRRQLLTHGLWVVAIVLWCYHAFQAARWFLGPGNAGTHSQAFDSGGWKTPNRAAISLLGTNRCNIERRWAHELSREEFEARYRFRRPVLLRFRFGCRDWIACERWTRQAMVERYGHRTVGAGRSETIVQTGGHGSEKSSFKHFVFEAMEERNKKGEPL